MTELKKGPINEPKRDEYLDLVNSNDQVVGCILRSQAYKESLSNIRVVNAFLVNKSRQLWIPRRRPDKKIFPNGLDFSMGEHVESGESYDQAFKRGLQEELNITTTDYQLLGKLTPQLHGTGAFMQIYEVYSDETPKYNPADFSENSWIDPEELRERIERGELTKSDLIVVLNHFYTTEKNKLFYQEK